MDLISHYQTSKFVVKNARDFKKLFEENVEGDKQLIAEKDGLRIVGVNLVYNDPHEECEVDSIAELISNNLRDDHDANLIITHHGSNLDAEFYHMTQYGITHSNAFNILAQLKKEHYPRKLKCLRSVRHDTNKVWIEEGTTYLITEKTKHNNREMYVVRYEDGNKVYWGKEYFDESNGNS